MARKNYVAIPPKSLKTDVLSTDSTFKIRDILWYTGSDGVDVNLAASDFGSDNVGYGVFEPKTAREEWFTFSSANMATAVTGGLTISARGLIRTAPYTTEAAARKYNHESGSIVLLYTNSPAFYDTFINKGNDEVITGQWQLPTGANYPTVGATYSAPTADNDVAPKKYVDDTASFGAPAATNSTAGIDKIAATTQTIAGTNDDGTHTYVIPVGLTKTTSAGAGDQGKVPLLGSAGVLSQTFLDSARTWGAVQSFTADNAQITSDANSANDAVRYSMLQTVVSTDIPKGSLSGTSGEAITAGQGVYIKASDGKLWKTVGSANESTFQFVGIANTTVGAADLTVSYSPPGHQVTGLSGLTAGSFYYVSDTAGTLATTPGTRFARVGIAISTTVMLVTLPHYRNSGSQTFTSVTSAIQTCGFYPAKITLAVRSNRVVGATDYAGGSFSVTGAGIDENKTGTGGATSPGFQSTAGESWNCVSNNTATVTSAGAVTTKTVTGFTLNETTHVGGDQTSIYWVAESL